MNHNIVLGMIFTSCLLAACAAQHERYQTAQTIADTNDFVPDSVDTGQFRLRVFHKGTGHENKVIHVYIEGDGLAWKRRHILSNDPTPVNPVALKLAARDSHPAVLYIARPCQYLDHETLQKCDAKYWSSHRYSDEVIHAINRVVDWGVELFRADRVYLYGYSGGGVVAALVAARRSDVARLTTVAANLDPVLWTGMHNVSPLTGSLHPADYAHILQGIPQIHYAGSKDKIAPVRIIESYRTRFTDFTNIKINEIEGFDHHCCWVESWPLFLNETMPRANSD